MSDSDDKWIELLEADEFWPRILADDEFWSKFLALEPQQRDAAFMERIRTDPGFVAERDQQVRELHARNGGLIMTLIEMIGLAEARKKLQRRSH